MPKFKYSKEIELIKSGSINYHTSGILLLFIGKAIQEHVYSKYSKGRDSLSIYIFIKWHNSWDLFSYIWDQISTKQPSLHGQRMLNQPACIAHTQPVHIQHISNVPAHIPTRATSPHFQCTSTIACSASLQCPASNVVSYVACSQAIHFTYC